MAQQIRVLIVDDSARSREGLRALLVTNQEIEVVGEASNGQQAIQMVEEHCPDVVLMDVRMPLIDGLEATRCIKHKCPATSVIILTLYPRYRSRALAAGAAAFLVKGGASEKLLRTIRACGPAPSSEHNPAPPPLLCTAPCCETQTGR